MNTFDPGTLRTTRLEVLFICQLSTSNGPCNIDNPRRLSTFIAAETVAPLNAFISSPGTAAPAALENKARRSPPRIEIPALDPPLAEANIEFPPANETLPLDTPPNAELKLGDPPIIFS